MRWVSSSRGSILLGSALSPEPSSASSESGRPTDPNADAGSHLAFRRAPPGTARVTPFVTVRTSSTTLPVSRPPSASGRT